MPRLLLIQIDGLSAPRAERALAAGDLPSLAELVRRGARLEGRVSAVPPSTPVFQALLLYGRQHVVHGYSWFDRGTGRVCRMDNPRDVAEIEARLEADASSQPLLAGIGRGTASYFMGFVGGAGRAALSLATGLLPSWMVARGKGRGLAAAPLLALARGVWRLPRELARAARDMIRFVRAQRTTRFEWNFVAMRLLNSAAFEEVATRGALRDLRKGAPMVYINYIGYDEAAHRRGPDHPTCIAQLGRIDSHIARLLDEAARRRYEVLVLSDHGQAACVPFARVARRSLAAVVMLACRADASPPIDEEAVALADTVDEARVRAARLQKWPGALGRVTSARSAATARRAAQELQRRYAIPAGEVAVVTGGSVAHVYVGRAPDGVPLEEIERRFPRLVPTLIASRGVGLLLARKTSRGPVVHHGGRWARLDDPEALAELPPFREVGVETLGGILRRTLAAPSAGDLILYGAFAPAGTVSFEPELGSHGGIHPDELSLFVLRPEKLTLPGGESLDPAELGKSLRIRYAAA